MVIQVHYVELCFTCHPQYGLLSDHVDAIGMEGATLLAERRAGRECSCVGNHSNNTWPDSVKVFLQIQLIISVEIKTSSRCVVDIQKSLGLTLIQKAKFNQQKKTPKIKIVSPPTPFLICFSRVCKEVWS